MWLELQLEQLLVECGKCLKLGFLLGLLERLE
jgi:hypothetical protein